MTVRTSILHYADRGPFTASDVAEDTGLNGDTIRAVIPQLVGAGILVKVGERKGYKGRPQNVYDRTEADRILREAAHRQSFFQLVRSFFSARAK